MKTNKEYDKQIKKVLLEEVSKIEPSTGLLDNIKKDIYNQEVEKTMRNRTIGFRKSRRTVVIAASFILLGAITVLGVTTGRSWVGHSNHKYKDFPSQERIRKDVGFAPKYPKSLPVGFEYISGGTGESQLSDDAGNVLTKTKEVSLGYKRENEKELLTLTITGIEESFLDRNESKLVGNIDGIDLYYYRKEYKFVPANYTLTEEDKRAQDAGELEISYGASEVTFANMQGLSWYEDGLNYSIIGSDYGFAIEEMVDMAKVVMNTIPNK